MCEDTKLKAIHNYHKMATSKEPLSSMCEDTKLKAIHNIGMELGMDAELSSMCEDTKLKAIHNIVTISFLILPVVFNVRRY